MNEVTEHLRYTTYYIYTGNYIAEDFAFAYLIIEQKCLKKYPPVLSMYRCAIPLFCCCF